MQPGLQGYIKRRRGTPSGLQYGLLGSWGAQPAGACLEGGGAL